MATKTPTSAGPIYVLKGRHFRSVRVDIPRKIRTRIPWVVTTDTTVRDMTRQLKEVPLETLFVIDNKGTLVGVITNNAEAASKICGGGGGGGTANPQASRKNCQAECKAACLNRGGCAWVSYDPFGGSTKCTWECNDTNQQASTIGDIWF